MNSGNPKNPRNTQEMSDYLNAQGIPRNPEYLQAIKDLLNAKEIPGCSETGKIQNFLDALMNPGYSGKSWKHRILPTETQKIKKTEQVKEN